MQKSALIAMSGGVDSSVSAFLMQQDGFDCAGGVMKLFPIDPAAKSNAVDDASVVAEQLGLPFHVFDLSDNFKKCVISSFVKDYEEGRTPNPCVVCNKNLKFGMLLDKALEIEKNYIVTGHYVRTERDANGRYLLKKGSDSSKDQSYVLYTLSQKQLSHVMFPLGDKTKAQVREIAGEIGLKSAQKGDSQDICFIPDGDYVNYLTKNVGLKPKKGRFIDIDGNILGENKGIISYTVGQRKGLGLAMPHPTYVLELRPEDNSVVVGKDEMLYKKTLTVRDINLIALDKIASPIRAEVKIRYAHQAQPATVSQIDDDTLHIEFDEPQRAIAKGQAAVIYDSDLIIGGGTIC